MGTKSTQVGTEKSLFPGLSAHGNYTGASVPLEHVFVIQLDRTIVVAKALAIPFVEVIEMELAYGDKYFPKIVGYAIPLAYKPALDAELKLRAEKTKVKPHEDILLCIREASNYAHEKRDNTKLHKLLGHHGLATKAKMKKYDWYGLKDRGIMALHRANILRYVGVTAQGFALYEYGKGGMSCFHSRIHPVGIERPLVKEHPDNLRVETRDKARGISLERVKATLSALPLDTTGYVRIACRGDVRNSPGCWTCGEDDHFASDCPY